MRTRPLLLTWQRYFLKEFLRSILFILAVIYGLYVLIDAMAHLKDVADSKSTFFEWVEYYLCTFSRRIDILLPFSILLATIRCLHNFTQRGELVALLASGISMRRLLRPFLATVIGSMCCLYLNYQYFLPKALPQLSAFLETRFGKDKPEEAVDVPREVILEDHSKIIYSRYNSGTKEFQDVFWVRNLDSIYHAKTLSLQSEIPKGRWVDKIERNKAKVLEQTASYETLDFRDMKFNMLALKTSVTAPSELSLKQLAIQFPLYFSSYSHKAGEIKANLYFKIAFPLLCFIAFLAPIPICLRFTRSFPLLSVYLLAISGLFCLNVLFQASFAIAKTQVVSPALVITLPWAFVLYLFIRRYRAV